MKAMLLVAMAGVAVGGVGLGQTAAAPAGTVQAAPDPPRACFRSVAEAIGQRRTTEGEAARSGYPGFRLEDIRRDPLTNKVWATVRSCEHPEQPPITVAAPEVGQPGSAGPQKTEYVFTAPMVKAGATVRLVQNQANVRLEMPAVAQSNGMLGDRIRVRVVRLTGGVGTNGQILVGIVKGPEVLELEQEE